AAIIPQRQREHAVEVGQEIVAVLLVGVRDDLGVGSGAEAVAAALQLRAQFAEVVDLAIEDDRDALVLVADGLVPGLEVDDSQPARHQADAGTEVVAGAIRTAMDQRIPEAPEQLLRRLAPPTVHDPRDSAHASAAPR